MKYIIITILLALAIWSCNSVKYVPVESIKTDTTYITKYQRDSIFAKDSIYIHDRGDTVIIYKDRYKYEYRNIIDTLYISKTDSIRVPYPVEKELTWWQRVKMNTGGAALILVIIAILIIVGKLVHKLIK